MDERPLGGPPATHGSLRRPTGGSQAVHGIGLPRPVVAGGVPPGMDNHIAHQLTRAVLDQAGEAPTA